MGVFSTERFGLRRRMGSTFSKRVEIDNVPFNKITFKNHQNWDDLGVGGSPRAHIRSE